MRFSKYGGIAGFFLLRRNTKIPGRLAGILALVAALAPALVYAAEAPQVQARARAAVPNLFAQQASQLHANTCAKLYTTLGDLAVAGATYSLKTEADRASPDAHSVRGTAGMTYNLAGLKGQAAALVSAAPLGNSCEGQFVRVVPFRSDCQQLLRDFPAGSKSTGNLSGVTMYDLGPNRGQALVIPSGATCVIVSIFQGRQQP